MSIDLQPVRGTKDLIGEDARRHFHVIETAVTFGCADESLLVFFESKEGIEQWFEMALTDKGSAVAGVA